MSVQERARLISVRSLRWPRALLCRAVSRRHPHGSRPFSVEQMGEPSHIPFRRRPFSLFLSFSLSLFLILWNSKQLREPSRLRVRKSHHAVVRTKEALRGRRRKPNCFFVLDISTWLPAPGKPRGAGGICRFLHWNKMSERGSTNQSGIN